MQPFFRECPKAANGNLYYIGNVPQYIENVKENFMEDKKKTLTEYEKEISEAQEMEEANTHKRKVRSFKRMLMVTFLVVCAIPITLCMFLMVKMNRLDHRIENLVDRVEEGKNLVSTNIGLIDESTETMTSEQMAYGDLGKGSEGVHVALTDNGDGSNKTTDDAEATTEAASDVPEQTYYNGQKVYLTFDDGPSTYTGELLDVLKENNVKATFFVVYNDDKEAQQYYKRIVDEGHSIGMHSYSHVYDQVYASQESFEEDVTKIHDYIQEQTGVDTHLYRFPGGSSNQVSKVDIQDLIGYLHDEGIVYYDWNSLSGDAVDASLTPSELNDNILGYVHANAGDSVILMHDLQNNHATIEALPALIQTLKDEGYEICPIDDSTKPVQHVEYKGDK